MKKLLIFILLISPIIGCRSYTVVVKDDPFKNSTVISVDMWHTVVEGDVDNTAVRYKREVKQGVSSPTIVTMEFTAGSVFMPSYMSGNINVDMSQWAYINIDNKNYKIKIYDIQSEKNESLYGFVGDGSIDIHTSKWKNFTAKLKLTPEIETAILSANKYMIRVHIGKKPITLEATSGQLKKLKEYVKATPEKK